jgi:hypothetical protein
MDLKQWHKPSPRLDQRMRQIAELGRLRDRLLESPILDLPALERLVADYEAAGLPSAAASLRRRLDWYRSGKIQSEQPCLPRLFSRGGVFVPPFVSEERIPASFSRHA